MALPPIPSQASQLPRALQPAAAHHQSSAGLNLHNASGSNNIAAVSIPRRRVSYLIPPPLESRPPPLLTLPTGSPEEIRARKRGNPNPLIMLANPDALIAAEEDSDMSFGSIGKEKDPDRPRSGSNDNRFSNRRTSNAGRVGTSGDNTASVTNLSSSLTASSSSAATSTSSRHYHSNNNTIQRHPEHTLGITALALDTSTIIDNSSSPSRRKTPGGILYSGGRDGLVASWELGLPFRKRDSEEAYIGGQNRKGKRRPYLPRWAEDSYADDDLQIHGEDEDEEEEESSSDEETANARRNTRAASHSRDLYEDNEAEELLLGDGDDGQYVASSPPLPGSSHRLRLDTNFGGHTGLGSGLQLDLNRQKDRRRRSTSSHKMFALNGSKKVDQSSFPYENRWRLDTEQLEARSYQPRPTTFRQAHRGHTNWVNDIVLCNLNQTVISASSDRMIRAWNPHDPHRSMLPAALGSHNDYVKCLTHARESGWIASGGFDRKIKIWDVMESREEPISEYDMTGSVYALASNPSGSTIVAGSPEKVVRIFDPRSSRAANPVAGLVGHADNVRALLVSEDGRHVLSASSDSTVKMWSVSMRRCLHTFTHHSDSVWSLFSSHPHLEVFYSGDRTGTVCKVDFENAGDISTDGECVILLRNRDGYRPGVASSNDGIHRLVALDDAYVWTASNSSNICRWKDIPRKAKRNAAHAHPSLTRQDTLLASKHYPASIPEHDETGSPGSAAPIPIIGMASEEHPATRTKLSRARSNSSISRDRVPGTSQHSVAFATSPFQRSSPQTGSPLSAAMQSQQAKPSSLRFSANSKPRSTHSFSSSPPMQTFSPAFSPSRGVADDLFAASYTSAATPLGDQGSVPSQNGIPLESLVPMFTLDDPYGGTSGFALGSAVGYSASVLSLHRTSSRPTPGPVSSPFSSNNYPTPPSSGLSMPRPPLGFLGRSNSPMPNALSASTPYHRPSSLLEDEEAYMSPQQRPKSEAYIAAQQEYVDRETAIDGMPLRQAPDDVIRGRSGLVRAELLNDRRTVISLDTQGEVAVWDIILGSCIGRFPRHVTRNRPMSTLSNTSTLSEGDASTAAGLEDVDVLENIRNQIEGEAIVQSWCTVECRTGLLTVHIEQGRAFDAEVYLDEAGVPPKPEYRVDQRLNLGKWVLRNLFDAFLQEENKAQIRRNRSGSTATSDHAPSIHSNSSVEELSMQSSAINNKSTQNTVHVYSSEAADIPAAGFSTALATPAMTPAVLPDQSDLAQQMTAPRLLPSSGAAAAPLSPIPQSPMGTTTVPATPSGALQRVEGDYFSRPRAVSDTPPVTNNGGMPTPKAVDLPLPSVPVSASPATKVSKMSRFKSFGKKDTPKKEASAPDLSKLQPGSDEEKAVSHNSGGTNDDKDTHLTPIQKLQLSFLQAIFSHPIHPPPWHETPPIRFGADLPVMIEEESHDAGAWATVFRSTMSMMPAELRQLEMTVPPWLLEFLWHNVAAHKDPVKIAFILEPHGGPEQAGLDELPSGATRMLRMRKACHYVAEKLELESWKQRMRYQAQIDDTKASNTSASQLNTSLTRSSTKTSLSSSASSYTHLQNAVADGIEEPTLLPEDEVEILCNNEPVPLNMTLAACAKFCYGKAGDVYLTYRRRELDARL